VPLVARSKKVHPVDFAGRYKRARRVVALLLLAFLVLVPWIKIHGLPAAMFDIPGRRFILVGTVFTPHDAWALALLLMIAALGLFLWTAVLGRIWCGWTCPQTVFVEWIYRPIERFVEGPAHRRRKRDAGPRNGSWLWRKVVKHLLYVVVAVAGAGIFMSWFVGGPQLVRGELGGTGVAVGAFLAATFYLDGSWFREQFCTLVCPYARLQGALMDEGSLAVAYDPFRGEPRGKLRKGSVEEKGDCVDCGRCVQVCPTGIDIRDGDQLSCIACTSCADACDAVMIKIGKPVGLVRYTTNRDAPGHPGEAKLRFGIRTTLYSVLLFLLIGGLTYGLAARSELKLGIARSGVATLYSELPDGRISNQVSVHIHNRDRHDHEFTVLSGTEGVEVTVPGLPWAVAWGEEARLQGFVVAERDAFQGGRLPVTVVVERDDGLRAEIAMTLLGPGPGAARVSANETTGDRR
jgi:cytochrome c oxidase accessory protein FixG